MTTPLQPQIDDFDRRLQALELDFHRLRRLASAETPRAPRAPSLIASPPEDRVSACAERPGTPPLSPSLAFAGDLTGSRTVKTHWRSLRIAGFALFAVSLGKIFLYDLSSLSSITRALSFLAVGAVLLLGGFFYQLLSSER